MNNRQTNLMLAVFRINQMENPYNSSLCSFFSSTDLGLRPVQAKSARFRWATAGTAGHSMTSLAIYFFQRQGKKAALYMGLLPSPLSGRKTLLTFQKGPHP